MALPKLNVMTHTMKLPSTGEELTYRPFLVKEEKILMMAMQSGEAKDMVRALRQIISSCVQKDIDVDRLPMFDIEYMFIQLRARSVGEMIELNYSIPEDKCDKIANAPCNYSVKINLDDVEVFKDPKHNDLIQLTDEIKVKMKYPKIETTASLSGVTGNELVNKTFEMIGESIEYIMEGVEIHKTTDYSQKEIEEFLNSLSSQQFRKIQDFFETMPKLKKEVVGKCTSCGKENKRVLEGMADFFV